MVIELPPVEADLLGFVDRADEQPDADRQELDFRKRDLDVAGDDQPLVKDPIEDVDKTCRSTVPLAQWRRHRVRILRNFLTLAGSVTARDSLISAMAVPSARWANFLGRPSECIEARQ